MKFKYAALVLSITLAAVSALSADDKDLLKIIDAQVSFPGDFSAEYTITKTTPGAGSSKTVAAIFRRDTEKKYLILILEPESDKGKGYLKIEDGLWLYSPKDKAFTYSSSRERFQNSNARNSDFTSSDFAGNYTITNIGREKIGKLDCRVLDLKASNDEVEYPFCRIWITADNLVRKTEDYSLSHEILRTTAIPSWQKLGNRYVPVTMVIADMLKGAKIKGKIEYEQTRIDIADPVLKALPSSIYSKDYLRNAGTK